MGPRPGPGHGGVPALGPHPRRLRRRSSQLPRTGRAVGRCARWAPRAASAVTLPVAHLGWRLVTLGRLSELVRLLGRWAAILRSPILDQRREERWPFRETR